MSQNSIILPTTGTVSGLQMTQYTNNALDTLNTMSSGASAPSSPEAGQLWHDTTNNILKLRNLANSAWIPLFNIDETNGVAQVVQLGNAIIPPQGRLTLVSNAPVLINDVTGATSIYYTPYTGSTISIYNSAEFINYLFTQLTLTLNTSNHLSGYLYDVFVWNNSGTLAIGTGPAWASGSPGSSSRSAAIGQLKGIWCNAGSITLINGATTYSGIPANQATYVGTFYATANGQTGVMLKPSPQAGGNSPIVGLYNAYNRLKAYSMARDSNSSWTYSTATWRKSDNSASNAVYWVDGLQNTSIQAIAQQYCTNSVLNGAAQIGVNLNAQTGAPNIIGNMPAGQTNQGESISVSESFYPQLGFNYLQMMEFASTGTATFFGAGYQQLTVSLEV